MTTPGDPIPDLLEKSDKPSKPTLGGELGYYLKNTREHWPVIENEPNAEGHGARFTRDGKFPATHEQPRRDAVLGVF